MIAHRTKRTIEQKYDEDPVFYAKFSKLIEKAIEDYRTKRITEVEYFGQVTEYMDCVRNRKEEGMPAILEKHDVAQAFYGIVNQILEVRGIANKELSAELGIGIDEIIARLRIVDFQHNKDIQNKMKNEIEDYLLDYSELKLSFEDVDDIMDKCIDVAKTRYV
jgi:type I restriction enzyme R subunit